MKSKKTIRREYWRSVAREEAQKAAGAKTPEQKAKHELAARDAHSKAKSGSKTPFEV